jgi:phosphoglycerate dehydrogenase-like enzyme
LNAESLAACKPGVTIVNVARGALVDHEALALAIDEGRVGAAGLDVFEPEPFDATHRLARHPRVIVSPHVAAVTRSVVNATASIIAENVRRVLLGRRPLYVVT